MLASVCKLTITATSSGHCLSKWALGGIHQRAQMGKLFCRNGGRCIVAIVHMSIRHHVMHLDLYNSLYDASFSGGDVTVEMRGALMLRSSRVVHIDLRTIH